MGKFGVLKSMTGAMHSSLMPDVLLNVYHFPASIFFSILKILEYKTTMYLFLIMLQNIAILKLLIEYI